MVVTMSSIKKASASSSVGAKKISQNDLRRLMSDHKRKLSQTVKRIESPLAKYSEDGVLKCIVCDAVVKSEALWSVHINAKEHRDNIARRKLAAAGISPEPPAPPAPMVMPGPAPFKPVVKRSKDPPQDAPAPKKPKSILKNAPPLPPGFFDDVTSSTEPTPVQILKVQEDDQIENNTQVTSKSEAMAIDDQAPLPEGFFDDPVMDARARKVEYKDPMEEEWDKFVKTMKEENSVSNQIIEDDTEVAVAERQMIEVDEQLRKWSRVLDLEIKKEKVVKGKEKTLREEIKKEEVGDSEDEDMEDLEDPDWRAKTT